MRNTNLFHGFTWLIVGLGGVLMCLGGCSNSSGSPVATAVASQVAVPAVVPQPPVAETVTLTATIVITQEIAPAGSEAMTLTMWTTEAFSPLQNDLGSQVLEQQVTEFTSQNPQIGIDFSLKKAYGEGGIRDYLHSTAAVVPQRLPDVAILDMVDLAELAGEGLLRPLESLVSQELQDGLFPAARKGCTVEGHLVGIPFELDLLHLAYNTDMLQSPPLTWSQVLSGTASYIFPAGGEEADRVNTSIWLQLVALNPDALELGSGPALDESYLEQVFEFYWQGIQRGVIPESVVDYRSEADAWSAYLSDQASMTDVSSFRYLNNRALLRATDFAPIPTYNGRAFSLTKGWALVIVAADPRRQEASAKFLEWLLQPENSGAWTKASDRLPAIRSALETWGQSDRYVPFARDLLEIAEPHPDGHSYDVVSKALQRGLRDVITGVASPREAASTAVNAIGN